MDVNHIGNLSINLTKVINEYVGSLQLLLIEYACNNRMSMDKTPL